MPLEPREIGFISRQALPSLLRALEALEAFPMRPDTHLPWTEARSKIREAISVHFELLKLAEWLALKNSGTPARSTLKKSRKTLELS